MRDEGSLRHSTRFLTGERFFAALRMTRFSEDRTRQGKGVGRFSLCHPEERCARRACDEGSLRRSARFLTGEILRCAQNDTIR